MRRRNWLFIVLGGIGLFLFIVGSSYAWYLVFNRNTTLLANLEIKILDQGKGVSILNTSPVSDSEGKGYSPYLFDVENKGRGLGRYQLILEEVPLEDVHDGCSSKTLLSRDQLRYQLLLNDVQIQIGSLDSLKNSVFLTNDIKLGEAHHYELRVWLDEKKDDTDWAGKHYHYRVAIKTVTSKGKEG